MNFKKHNLIYCRSAFSKLRGLMFSRKKNLVFVLEEESLVNAVVHTFFVFFPIDIYWLNNKKEIVDFRKNLKPFRIAIPKKKAKYIVEITS